MKYNKIISKKDVEDKNMFFIAGISGVFLLLIMCFFGISNNIKGTLAADVNYTCSNSADKVGDFVKTYLNGSQMVEQIRYNNHCIRELASGTCYVTTVGSSVLYENCSQYNYDYHCVKTGRSVVEQRYKQCTRGSEVQSCDVQSSTGCAGLEAQGYSCTWAESDNYSCVMYNDNGSAKEVVEGGYNLDCSNYTTDDKTGNSECTITKESSTEPSCPSGWTKESCSTTDLSVMGGEEVYTCKCVKKTACYKCASGYFWTNSPFSSCTLVSNATDEASCKNAGETAKTYVCYFCNTQVSGKHYHWAEDGDVYLQDEVGCTEKTADASQSACEARNNVAQTYVVTYDANGGSVTTSSVNVTSGNSVTLPTPYRSGYTFTGWHTANVNGVNVGGAGASYTPKKSITLYAQWQSNGGQGGPTDTVTYTYTATFNANGGTLNGSSSKSCTTTGTSCTIGGLPTASKNGYTFNGWDTSSSCTSGNKSTLTLSQHTTYYACYTNNSGNSGNTNVDTNPTTGEITIALVWFAGLFAIAYAVYYFKQVKQN